MEGVERGPSPPEFSGVPESPPPSYLAMAIGTAQSSFPESASRARQTSRLAPSTFRPTKVNALPPPTTNELNPLGVGTFHRAPGPPSGHFEKFSPDFPS